MKEKQADGVGGHILVSGRFLLIDLHVSQLCVEVRCELVADAGEEAILVEGIVDNLTTKVDEYFVHDGEEWRFRYDFFARERNEERKVIAKPVIKIVTVEQFVAGNLTVETLFEPQPLHRSEAGVFLVPPDLLPGAVLGARRIEAFGREVINKGIADVDAQVVFHEVCHGGTEHELKRAIDEMIGLPVMYVQPNTELVGEACLIEEAKPQLLAVVNFLLHRLRGGEVAGGDDKRYNQ